MDSKIIKIAVKCAAIGVIILLVLLLVRYGLPLFLPFLLSYAVSAAVRPAAAFVSKKTGISKRICTPAMIVLFFLLAALLLWFLASTVLREAVDIVKGAGEMLADSESPLRRATDKMMGAVRKIDSFEKIDINAMISSGLSKAAEYITGALSSLFSALPAALFFAVVTVISIFYFSCDSEGIKREAQKYISPDISKKIGEWTDTALRALKRFLRAYLSLFLITFALLCAGLFFVGIDYPFLWALITALVDILPVFGVGAVLVPWAIVLFVVGETGKGVGMLVLLTVIYCTRQILEPRLVGGAAGVHPLLALAAVFAGFRTAGFMGMIFAPVILNAVSILFEERRKKP